MSKFEEPKYSRKAVAAAKAPKYGKVYVLSPEVTEHYNQRAAAYVAQMNQAKTPTKNRVSKKRAPTALVRVLSEQHGLDEARRFIEKVEKEHDVEECDGKCAGCRWEEWYHGYQEGPEPECPPGHEP